MPALEPTTTSHVAIVQGDPLFLFLLSPEPPTHLPLYDSLDDLLIQSQ